MVIERDANTTTTAPNQSVDQQGGGLQGGQPNSSNVAAAHNLDDGALGGSANFIRPPKPLVVGGESIANNWKLWIQQYEWFEIATNMRHKSQNVQVATFMSSIGTDAVVIFNTFGCTAEEMGCIDEIKRRFAAYFTPKTNITYERYQFNRMVQLEGETFDEFLTKIKAQSAKCGFDALHDSLLRDKIIVGIRSETVREQLLADDDSTLDRVTQRCRASELASKQLRVLKDADSSDIHAITKYRNNNNNQRYDNKATSSSDTFDCKRCGRQHGPKSCPAFKKRCNKCGRDGHFAEMCKGKADGARKTFTKKPSRSVHMVDEQDENDDNFYVNAIDDERQPTNMDDERNWFEQVDIEKVRVKVKLDSGAQCNVLPRKVVDQVGAVMRESRTKRIITYGGDRINVAGEIVAKTRIRGSVYNVKYIVVAEDVSPVMGKASCEETGLILRVKAIDTSASVFEGLGCLKDFEYDIDFIDNPSFEIHAARRIPHAYRDMVKAELDSMVQQKVIREVTEATPAVSPMVVVKQHGKIRICIDPTDVNKNVIRRHYPLKTLEEIAAKVAGATVFSKLDCKKGFWQIRLSERTQKFLTFATPWGRYSCIKLPFGLCSAPEVFQQIMSRLLSGVSNAEASMDDILIYAKNSTELEQTTAEVLKRIEAAGLTLNKQKCEFGVNKIKFLGHMLSAKGVEIDPEKADTINKLRAPENKTELQRILGMVTYLAKFIPNLSEITHPLRKLLEKESEWVWTNHQSKAFDKIKNALSSPPVLRFYDVNKDVTLQADASSYALGAAIMQDGQPVAYASRSLSKAELNYPQIEKEALAIRFACQRYHEYIYGKQLTVETDHKPLESIFKKPIANAPPRLQRILLDITPYSPTVVYKKGETMFIADTLSRDIDNGKPEASEDFEVLAILSMSDKAVDRLQHATDQDESMQLVRRYVQEGWPNEQQMVQEPARAYWNFRDELSEYDGLMYKGQKVIVPASEKLNMLTQLHTGHQGVQRTIAIARNHVFWLNMAKDITEFISRCSACESTQRNNTKEPLIIKEIPSFPFEIVATDLFTFKSREFLLIVDSYSGFFDFKVLQNTTSKEIIEHLKTWFATHGIPAKLESDNGPQYASSEFRKFAAEWGIRHVTSSPKYPRSNGLAERFVQTAKNMLKKCTNDNTDIKLALLNYRNTPRNDALGSPNQRLMSRTTRSLLPTNTKQLRPQAVEGVSEMLRKAREQQKQYYDRNTRAATPLQVGEQVRLQQDHRNWTGAQVVSRSNVPRSYTVRTDDGRTYRRNSSQLRSTRATIEQHPSIAVDAPARSTVDAEQNRAPPPTEPTEPAQAMQSTQRPGAEPAAQPAQRHHTAPAQTQNTQTITRSGRIVKRVEKMNL